MVSPIFWNGQFYPLILRVIVISTLVPSLFSPPPYLFTSKQIGLFSLASFVGTFISFPFAGILPDILSRALRKRNNGIHKPEHRLPALILPLLICPAGLFLFGYSVNNKEKYIVPAVGFAMQSTGLTIVPSILLSYVVDSFPDTSGEALVLINAGKNLIAFGLTLKASGWLMKSGVKVQFIEMASIELGLILILGLILLLFGPCLRRLARHSRIFSPFHTQRD
jgi:MFS family permease